jgi:hypothetical protein
MRFAFANVASFVSWHGETVILNLNDPWDAADPFVRARPDLFSDRPTFVHHTSGHEPGRVVDVSADRRRGNRG